MFFQFQKLFLFSYLQKQKDMYEEKLFDKVLKHFLNDEEIQQNDNENNVKIESCDEELDDEVSAEDDDSAYADDDDEESRNNLKAKSIILLQY